MYIHKTEMVILGHFQGDTDHDIGSEIIPTRMC